MAFDIQKHKNQRRSTFSWLGIATSKSFKDMSISEIENFIKKEKNNMTRWFLETLENEIIYKKFLNRIKNVTKL